MKRLFVSLVLGSLLVSCSKTDYAPGDYFAFGTARNFCGGDCARLYKISGNKLYPDNVDFYTGKMSFSDTPLPDEKFELASQLYENFPEYLRSHADTTFGCPDCVDQGGIHIEEKRDGILKSWHIDTDVNGQPEEIRAFIEQLLNTLAQLQ